jgi:hypothetical protein
MAHGQRHGFPCGVLPVASGKIKPALAPDVQIPCLPRCVTLSSDAGLCQPRFHGSMNLP